MSPFGRGGRRGRRRRSRARRLALLALGGATRMAGRTVRRQARGFRRELERPWRRGRKGAAAAVGRWIGFGLAVGSIAAGVGAALYTEWPRD